jgi:uncharacterized protein
LFANLRQAGFWVPETIVAGADREIDPGRSWLVKPVLSGGGHGIEFLQESELPGDQRILQEYIPGKSCSASFVSNGYECIVIGITEQLIGMEQFGSKGFRYCGNILPLPDSLSADRGKAILEQVTKLAAFLTREYGLTGVNGFDFILKGDRVFMTEVNPRYSASMELIEHAYELPLFQLHAEAALNGKLPDFSLESALKSNRFFGKAIIFAEKSTIVPDTSGWLNKTFRDIPVRGEALYAGNPICTLLNSGQTYEDVLNGLISRGAMLKEEIYD